MKSDKLDTYIWWIISSLQDDAVEDGFDHPAEDVMLNIIDRSGDDNLVLYKLFRSDRLERYREDFIKLMGRVDEELCGLSAPLVVSHIFKSGNFGETLNAIEAIERWENKAYLPFLLSLKETGKTYDMYLSSAIRFLMSL